MAPAAIETESVPGYKFNSSNALPLDENDYTISDEDKKFLKEFVGLSDDEKLRAHVLEVQRNAYDVCHKSYSVIAADML